MRENLIQNGIINYLQLRENQGDLYFFRSGAWAVRVKWAGWRDRFFRTWKAGCPDITVLHDGQFIWLEVKNEKGKQSDNQKTAEERILKSWGKYYIVRSIQDVIDIL